MIGYDDKNDRRVGVPRGPEVFGTSVIDGKRDELKNKIEEFEKRIDKEHVDMLQKMRAETRELERLRGVWSERGLSLIHI